MYVFLKRLVAVASEMLMVTDYRGHRQTILPVREINLKACTPVHEDVVSSLAVCVDFYR